MLKVTIAADVIGRFPCIEVGGFLVDDLDAAGDRLCAADLDRLWREVADGLRANGVRAETLAEVAPIKAWRSAFVGCDVKPSTFKGSVEALVRRVLKEGRVRTPLPIVDLYCALSARHMAPLGGYDRDRLGAGVEVRFGRPGRDSFSPLGARPEDMPIGQNVIVYASGNSVMCWMLNHRDSRETCLRSSTKQAVFFSESVCETHTALMRTALPHLRRELARLGAKVGPLAFAGQGCESASLEPSA